MKVVLESNQKCWFTSDHHFGHARILQWTDRGYDNVQEMDAGLIDKWNATVHPQDIVFHLGDFTLSGYDTAHRIFGRLNGTIYVLGNEDHHDKYWLKGVNEHLLSKSGEQVQILPPMVTLEFPQLARTEYPLVVALCHFPLLVWDRKHYDSYHFHGHLHGGQQEPTEEIPEWAYPQNRRLNVGVDMWHGVPLELEYAIRLCDETEELAERLKETDG